MRSILAHLLPCVLGLSLAGATFVPGAAAQDADAATIIVLDASGSMWGQLADGVTKVETARGVLRDYLANRNMSVPLGLVAYGHNRRGDCGDIEVLAGVGVQDPGALSDRIDRLSPKGKTPLTEALRIAAGQIPRTAEAADIVLVTDGLETCDADPCALARELAADGIEIRAHVVGFGLTDAEAETLACVPQLTGGRLLTPQTGDDLAGALAETDVASAEPPPSTSPATLPIRIDVREEGTTARPEFVDITATRAETGETMDLGRLEGAQQVLEGLATELAPGRWRITAEGPLGLGEIEVEITSDGQTVAVPYSASAGLTILPFGPLQAGAQQLVLIRYDRPMQENATYELFLRRPGADGEGFQTYVFASDAPYEEHRVDVPAEPGTYELVVMDQEETETFARASVEVLADAPPAIEAPARVRPRTRFPVRVTGQRYPNNGLTIRREGEKVSSIWLADTLGEDGEGLTAPAEPGTYTIALEYSDIAGERRTVDLATIEVTPDAPAEAVLGGAGDRAEAPYLGEGLDADAHGPEGPFDEAFLACPDGPCTFDHAETGLTGIPVATGWTLEEPYLYSTAGGATADAPTLVFRHPPSGDWIAINMRQITDAGCRAIGSGRFDEGPDQLCVPRDGRGETFTLSEEIEVWWNGWRAARRGDGDTAAPPSDGAEDTPSLAWEDHPLTCLDGVSEACELKDEASGLTVYLPQGWVATRPEVGGASAGGVPGTPLVHATLFEAGGDLRSYVLNPAPGTPGLPRCLATRAGELCTDAPADEDLDWRLAAFITLGSVARSCGSACDWTWGQWIEASLPARWRVETPRLLPGGRLATFFWSNAPRGRIQLLGLNQEGLMRPSGDCRQTALGPLCRYGAPVDAEYFDHIAGTLMPGQREGDGLTEARIEDLLDRLAPGRSPAPAVN